VRGQYVYYGRAFQIEEGRVTFLGHSPPNPRLDVKALYLAEESGTRVLLHAHGSIRDPRLDLSSEPPLSQQDVLAVLLFGAPLDQAGGGDGPGQEAAVEVLSGYLIKELRDTRLFRKLDIDVFRVRQTAAGGNELTVGRYLTEDLYVAYEQTVGEQGQRRLRAEYAFLPHWSILGRTAEDRYILDFLFKYDLP
jgi:translocation and assembly module TamB